ncbi:hypothetical protein J4Q44_G00003020 [Coregonus suidteri]|uniref:Uncharacterized protein n=1 Tax=Coregonus suidteri TaxID=861788 RepID=A0AAN8RA09_9TELE
MLCLIPLTAISHLHQQPLDGSLPPGDNEAEQLFLFSWSRDKKDILSPSGDLYHGPVCSPVANVTVLACWQSRGRLCLYPQPAVPAGSREVQHTLQSHFRMLTLAC